MTLPCLPPRRRLRGGFRFAFALGAALAVLLTAGPASANQLSGSRPAPPAAQQKVQRAVLDQLAARGAATFFVILRDRADLHAASTHRTRAERAAAVRTELRAHADRSQARLRRLLAASRVDYQPFWIANTVRVTAGPDLVEKIAALPEVARVVADGGVQIPKPTRGELQARIQAIEWNIDRIRAPEVWSTFGDRGDGIVVASIDTGVQFDHPALVRQYRGNLGGGTFDHNYNWFDPSQVCGSPSLAPCDNVFHGTHTMGTILGDDGDPGDNEVGVAPHAKWITAKGCEDFSCSFSALLASGQWIIAPTDLNGQNPRPDLAPDIVSNSWGDGPGNPFYQDIVAGWNAAGIFGVFANGNNGIAGCGSAGSPGDYPDSYSAGAFDINNAIADFSARGPSAFGGETKPNLAAPGVDVRSSVPGGGYESFSGTSMATPHVAGTVALIWAAAPALVGDIAATRQLLDDTAVDTEDLQCGGTADDNNVWGEGRLDAFAAVSAAPRGPTGTLAGTVTNQATGAPVQGAAVHATGPSDRTTFTRADGSYSLVLPVGSYDVTASHFGLLSQTTAGVAIAEGEQTTRDFALVPAPAHPVSGHVRDGTGTALDGVTVTIEGTPIPPATTGADGSYTFAAVPEGEYDLSAQPGGCYDPQTRHLVVDGAQTLDFTLPQRHDGYGYSCRRTTFDYIDAGTVLPLTGDLSSVQIDLPFPVAFYGQDYQKAYVTTKGFINFLAPNTTFDNGPIPSASRPNAAIYPFWDDLVVDSAASVRTELLGAAPNRRFVIEWRNVVFYNDFSKRIGFEVVLAENGQLTFQYRDIANDGVEEGDSATVGIENAAGDDALQYSFNQPQLADRTAILISLPPSAFLRGTVTDANDGNAVAGAQVRALRDGAVVRQTTTDGDGHYRIQLPLGTYTVEASATHYATGSAQVVLDQENQTVTRDFALRTARAEVSPGALEFTVPPGQTRTKTLTVTNTGTLDLSWQAAETAVAGATNAGKAQPAGPGTNSRTAQQGYVPKLSPTVLSGGPVLVFMDALPWGSDALTQVLTANGIGYDTAQSAQMGSIDLSRYDVVFLSSDQPQGFYDSYAANRDRFERYVEGGGFLWVGAAAWGWNGGDFTGGVLPGGVTVRQQFENLNDVVDNAHPTMQGVPDPFSGDYASHAAFDNLPAGATVVARGQSSGLPSLVEYDLGPGRVLALGQTLEFAWQNGQDGARILENGVPYAYAFEPVIDLPWLAESPVSGTLVPGASQTIAVTVNTTGLQPGLYRARILLRSNDPLNPRIEVPVTLTVPAYYRAVNAGGGDYTDGSGDLWSADRQYAAGGFGYLDPASRTARTTRPISGTDDDALYQTQRVNPGEYRFDGLPAGVYEIDLRFAELATRQPGTRLFDVIVEGSMVLPAHDVAAEVGSFAADRHTFRVSVTDGQLNIRFVERRGYAPPIVNAIRVVHLSAG